MAFTYAGLYFDAVTYPSGRTAGDKAVSVYVAGTSTLATLYTDRTKTSTAVNPTTTDASGNLTVWADPGRYTATVPGGSTFPFVIAVDAEDVTAVSGGGAYIPIVSAGTAIGVRTKTSATHGTGYVFGTASSFGFAGTGSPAEIAGAFGIYQEYGKAAHNTSIPKTTQGGYVVTNYWGPTTDDSAESFSVFVGLKAGTGGAVAQTKPLTAFESISQVENTNSATSMVAVGARINVLGSGHADLAEAFHVASNTTGGPPYGTITNFYGLRQSTASGATNSWGVYVADPVQSESALVVAKSGDGMLFQAKKAGSGGGSPGFVYIQNPDGTDMASLRIQAISGQTQPMATFWSNGSSFANAAVSRLGAISSTAGFFAQNSSGQTFVQFNNSGLGYGQASITQTTVGAAGTASALPSAPQRYWKVTDYDGTACVIPIYKAA